MLISGTSIIGCPVQSLHLGAPIAWTTEEVIDPNNLKIIAYRVQGPDTGGENGDILEMKSVREFSSIGMIVDSLDDLVSQTDVIRLDKIMRLNFSLVGLKVVTKSGTNLGKVIDYMVDPSDFSIRQLIIKRPFLKSFLDSELLIGRSQIVEVNDYSVVVKDESVKVGQSAEDFAPNFVNPFRKNETLSVTDNSTTRK